MQTEEEQSALCKSTEEGPTHSWRGPLSWMLGSEFTVK